MGKLLLALGLVSAASAAPVPKDFKKADDAIVGTWKAHRLTLHGEAIVNNDMQTLVFDANGKCHSVDATGQRLDWTFTLDPKATPKRMKWLSALGRGVAFDCIYELSGDAFKLGFLAAGKPVPDNVEPGPNVTLYEMTRVKGEK